MRQKWFVAGLLGLALVTVGGLILAVFWSSVGLFQGGGVRIRAFDVNNVQAEATEEQRFAVSPGAQLDLSTLSGDVTVTGGAGSEIVVTAHKVAWGSDDAEAQAALAELQVSMTQTGNRVVVKVEQPRFIDLVDTLGPGAVSFVVQVPADTLVDAATGYGDVTASGLTADVTLRSSSGQVSASDLGGDVSLRSDYGRVTLENAAPGAVSAFSSSGVVKLEQVEAAGAVELSSGYGDVSFVTGTADAVEARTSSGRVTLTDLTLTGAVEARSDYGNVSVLRVVAPGGYTLASSSGDVSLDGATGDVSAESGYGNVSVINADTVNLDLHSSSGAVTFAGSLGAGPHVLRSNYGNVGLKLPAETAADVELSTDYGSIRSALAITLAGDLDDEHWTGTLNGGGPSLTVHTNSGAITLELLTA